MVVLVRPQRVWLPEYYYHVTCRGNRRDALFMEDSDFRVFLYILRKIYEEHSFTIAAYCIMTNHYHMLLKTSEQPLSKIMSLINKRYASYFNIKYQLTGHVFEKRYFDKMIPDIAGMLKVFPITWGY